MDVVSPKQRSAMMAGIRSKDTKPELIVRALLHEQGFRYRLHRRDLPGRPDLVLPKFRAVIFVHGCFWHRHEGCSYFRLPATNAQFWDEKLSANAARDQVARERLNASGWRVLVIWECATRSAASRARLAMTIPKWLAGSKRLGVLPSPPSRRS